MTAPPAHLQVEPSAECNLRCGMCANRIRGDRPADGRPWMTPGSFGRLLDELPGVADVHLQGLGEPFLNPALLQMAREASGRGLVVSSTSNLAALDEATARAIPYSGLDCLFASLDSPVPATYASMRPGGRLGRVIDNIRRVIARRKSAGTGLPGVRITAVLTRENARQLSGLVELAAALGVDGLDVQNVIDAMGAAGGSPPYSDVREFIASRRLDDASLRDAESACLCAAETAGKLGLELNLPPLRRADSHVLCRWPWDTAYLTWRGDVLPCCMVGTPEVCVMGNAFERGFIEVWEGERFGRLRDRLSAGDPPEYCLTCSVYRGLL